MRYLLALLFVLAACVRASSQTVQAEGGSSTLFNSSGAAINLFFPANEASFGIGIAGGHLVAGAEDQFMFRGWDIAAGDHMLTFSGAGAGLSLNTRGLSAERKFKKSKVMVFVSSCGQTFSAPYFSGTTTQHFCAGFEYRRAVSPSLEIFSFAVKEGKTSAIQSAKWRWKVLKLEGSGGMLASEPFAEGDASVHVSYFSANATRQITVFDGATFSITSFGASTHVGALDLHGSYFVSSVSGYNYGAAASISVFSVHEDFYRSGATSVLSHTLIAKVSRRLTLTGSANDSQGRWTASYGGMLHSNLADISVSHGLAFVPSRGWQQVLSASISLQLPHSTTANFQTITTPTGAVKYAAWAGTYAQGPLAGSPQAGVQQAHRTGKYIVKIQVMDGEGQPVEGATIAIGKDEVTTDSTGSAWIREKKKDRPLLLRVVFEDFVTPGKWEVVSCPATATPSLEASVLEIKLRRK